MAVEIQKSAALERVKAIQTKHAWSPYSLDLEQDSYWGNRETRSTSRYRCRCLAEQAADGKQEVEAKKR